MSAVRARMFGSVSAAILARAVCSAALAIVYGFTMPLDRPLVAATGLCASQVAGDLLACLILGVSQRALLSLRPALWVDQALNMARAFRPILVALATSQLVANAYSPIAVFALTTFAGMETVGWYSMAVRIIGLPSSLMAQSISQVFRHRAYVAQTKGESFARLVMRVRLGASSVAAPPYIAIIAIGPVLCSFFLGSEWRIAGEFAAILAISGFLSFVAGVTERSSLFLNRPRYVVAWHSARLATEGLAAAGLALGLSVLNYVIVVSFLRSAIYVVELIYVHLVARHADQDRHV
jgi:O-antigen/teichoic acid export membrane protein